MNDGTALLLDKDRIADTIHRLFIGTDNLDWATVQGCFTPQVLFDMTSMAGGIPATMTPAQITDGWNQGLKDLKAVHHQVGNLVISVDGGTATAVCYGVAMHYLPNPSGQNIRTFVGSYDFHLIRSEDQWRIDRLRFIQKYADGNASLDG